MSSNSYILEVRYDSESDDYYLQFTDDILAKTGWQVGDELIWTQLDDQKWQLTKRLPSTT